MSTHAGGGLALLAAAAVAAAIGPASPAAAAPRCHASHRTTDAAKSSQRFLHCPSAGIRHLDQLQPMIRPMG